jgi:hypothetical protein
MAGVHESRGRVVVPVGRGCSVGGRVSAAGNFKEVSNPAERIVCHHLHLSEVRAHAVDRHHLYQDSSVKIQGCAPPCLVASMFD